MLASFRVPERRCQTKVLKVKRKITHIDIVYFHAVNLLIEIDLAK